MELKQQWVRNSFIKQQNATPLNNILDRSGDEYGNAQ